MSTIRPFKACRPAPEYVEQLASRPYDVLNREEAKAESNDHSFLRIIRAEIDLPDSVSAYDEQVYDQALKNFESFLSNGTLVQDDKACLYLYAQKMGNHQQTGIVACLSVQEYLDDIIKKHEFTRPEKEQDRINHISHMRAHTGPVLMAYPKVSIIDQIAEEVKEAQAPVYDFTSSDGIQHTFWVIDNEDTIEELVELFADEVHAIYIADGHHRAASSAKVAEALKAKNEAHTGEESYNYFLSVLFPDDQLRIMDYNRVVKDLNGLSVEDFIMSCMADFDVKLAKTTPYLPDAPYSFGMYLNGKWYALHAHDHTHQTDDPIESLPISVLSDFLLDPILGIEDQRADKRIDFVGGIRGLEELERRVDSGEMRVAFAIYPVSTQQLFEVANSGNVMPPKSTWFEPKLRSGLVSHRF